MTAAQMLEVPVPEQSSGRRFTPAARAVLEDLGLGRHGRARSGHQHQGALNED